MKSCRDEAIGLIARNSVTSGLMKVIPDADDVVHLFIGPIHSIVRVQKGCHVVFACRSGSADQHLNIPLPIFRQCSTIHLFKLFAQAITRKSRGVWCKVSFAFFGCDILHFDNRGRGTGVMRKTRSLRSSLRGNLIVRHPSPPFPCYTHCAMILIWNITLQLFMNRRYNMFAESEKMQGISR